jgi:hypothetical protein
MSTPEKALEVNFPTPERHTTLWPLDQSVHSNWTDAVTLCHQKAGPRPDCTGVSDRANNLHRQLGALSCTLRQG